MSDTLTTDSVYEVPQLYGGDGSRLARALITDENGRRWEFRAIGEEGGPSLDLDLEGFRLMVRHARSSTASGPSWSEQYARDVAELLGEIEELRAQRDAFMQAIDPDERFEWARSR